MKTAAKQTLCQDEASLEAGLEAMESAIDAMESGAKQRLGQDEAGLEAMEIAMDAIESGAKQTLGRPRGRPLGYGNCSKGETWLG